MADGRTLVPMAMPTETRQQRLHLRLSPADDGLIRAGAEAAHLSLTDFVVQAARASAARTLAERDHAVLDADSWDRLDARLRRAGRPNPKITELLSRPAVTGE